MEELLLIFIGIAALVGAAYFGYVLLCDIFDI